MNNVNVGTYKVPLQLENLIKHGLEKATENNHEVIVSYVEKVHDIDVFHFLNNNLSQFENENFYWEDTHSTFYIAGLGTVKKMNIMHMDNRFKNIKEEWQKLIDRSIIENPYPEVNGVGLALFGGFSFDYVKKESDLWKNFNHGLFYLPKYMVTKVDGQSYFTTNILCTPNREYNLNVEQLLLERKSVLSNAIKTLDNELIENDEHPKVEERNGMLWIERVNKAIDLLKIEIAKKVVLARELHLTYQQKINYMSVLNNLKNQQKNSYIFSMTSEKDCFIGATPERLVKKDGKRMLSSCVAGSAPRGKTDREDNHIKTDLLNDSKNLEEHQFVVDMITDAFHQLCDSVSRAKSPQIMTNKDIHHLYTPVEGWAKEGVSIFEFVKELHPTPALGGTPTETALQMIRDLELFERGMYAGPIGWVDYKQNGEFVVAIRSALLKDSEAVLFAGCGIVKDSIPDKEYEETKVKFRPMLRALGGNLDE